MPEALVNVGDVLAGKYKVEKILGRGAMGVVLAARQLELDRRVALKFLTAAQLGKEHHERFMREARVAAKLQSVHAAKVLDVGSLDQGQPYIVMEYLDGKDLAAMLQERGPLPVEDAVLYILQACEAVAEAHAAGIVHRDIKPANLFLTKSADGSPCVKLVDFGVAKMSDSALHLTGTVQTLGSPLYMAPEAMNGGRMTDGRTDVWALAVTLYELLAGLHVTPFQAHDLVSLVKSVMFDPAIPLEQYRPDVPQGLAAVIAQALEKNLDRRFPSVAAFAAALAPYGPASEAPAYAKRIARVQGADVVPSRPTDLLPGEHTPYAGRSYAAPPSSAARSLVAPPSAVGSAAAPAAPHDPARTLVLAGSVLLAGLLLALGAYFGLRARASGPEPVTTATAAPTPSIAATTVPTGSVLVEPAGTATASAQPAVTVTGATTPTASVPSTASHAKPAVTAPAKALPKPIDEADEHFKASRR